MRAGAIDLIRKPPESIAYLKDRVLDSAGRPTCSSCSPGSTRAEAWRAKARERRYIQAFRETHDNFLRRYIELQSKIERAIHEGPG